MRDWSESYEVLFDQGVLPGMEADFSAHRQGVIRYRTKTIRSGPILESEVYPVWSTRAECRKARAAVSREAQQKLNQKNSVKKFVRIVNANFTEEDIALTLTYAPGKTPADMKEAQQDVRNYLRQVRDWRRRNGLGELRYVYVVEGSRCKGSNKDHGSQMAIPGVTETESNGSFLSADSADSERAAPEQRSNRSPVQEGCPPKQPKRVHHHVIMSGMEREAAEKLWGKGWANCRQLQPDVYGLEALARYMTKERRAGLSRRWYGSRNLSQPKVTVSETRVSRRKVERLVEGIADGPGTIFNRAYPGYEFVDVQIRSSEFVCGFYVYARMRKITPQTNQRIKRRI